MSDARTEADGSAVRNRTFWNCMFTMSPMMFLLQSLLTVHVKTPKAKKSVKVQEGANVKEVRERRIVLANDGIASFSLLCS